MPPSFISAAPPVPDTWETRLWRLMGADDDTIRQGLEKRRADVAATSQGVGPMKSITDPIPGGNPEAPDLRSAMENVLLATPGHAASEALGVRPAEPIAAPGARRPPSKTQNVEALVSLVNGEGKGTLRQAERWDLARQIDLPSARALADHLTKDPPKGALPREAYKAEESRLAAEMKKEMDAELGPTEVLRRERSRQAVGARAVKVRENSKSKKELDILSPDPDPANERMAGKLFAGNAVAAGLLTEAETVGKTREEMRDVLKARADAIWTEEERLHELWLAEWRKGPDNQEIADARDAARNAYSRMSDLLKGVEEKSTTLYDKAVKAKRDGLLGALVQEDYRAKAAANRERAKGVSAARAAAPEWQAKLDASNKKYSDEAALRKAARTEADQKQKDFYAPLLEFAPAKDKRFVYVGADNLVKAGYSPEDVLRLRESDPDTLRTVLRTGLKVESIKKMFGAKFDAALGRGRK